MRRFSLKRSLLSGTISALVLGSALSNYHSSIPLATAEPLSLSDHCATGFADIVEKVKPSVVSVQVKSNASQNTFDNSFFDFPGFDSLPDDHPLKRFFQDFYNQRHKYKNGAPSKVRPIAQGSGFFVSQDGYIVTNNHVVSDGTAFSVVLDNGDELEAKLIGSDPRTDIAVLKVDSKQKFTAVPFADDTKMRIGDWVLAVGNPFGLGGTVTSGIISARGRDIGTSTYDDFIQIDAAVNRGNSGGPTFNLKGEVVGINTAIFSPSGGNVGIAFAIPATTAKQVVSQLIKKGSVERGWIGVRIQPVTKEIADSLGLKSTQGAIVAGVDNGPATKSGLKIGDAILEVNGKPIKDNRDLAQKIATISPSQKVNLTVWRHGKKIKITILVGSMPSSQSKTVSTAPAKGTEKIELEQFGLTVAVNQDREGVVVTSVDPTSDAADKGIRPGDAILSINNYPVKKVSDILQRALDAKKAGRTAVLLQIESNGQNYFVALQLNG